MRDRGQGKGRECNLLLNLPHSPRPDLGAAHPLVCQLTCCGRIRVRAPPSSPSSGFCGMVAISWYAFNITQEFFDPLYPGTK